MSGRLHAALRQLALAAALLLACWIASQGILLAWLAADAHSASSQRQSGTPWRHWDFAAPASIVAPGSSGLQGARHGREGLELPAGTGPVDLSLPLAGQRLPTGTAFAADLRLRGRGLFEVQLLGASVDGEAAVLARSTVRDAARLHWEVTTPAALDVLRLRVDRAQPAHMVLGSLSLSQPARCAGAGSSADCRHWHQAVVLDWAATPERLLAGRDAAQARWPLAEPVVPGVPAGLARAAAWALGDAPLPMLALLAAMGVLGWATHARIRGRRGEPSQLLPLLAVPVLLLACGWPRDDVHPPAAAAFAIALLACFVHPGGRRDWRWLGGPAAWRQAAMLAAAGIALLALLGALAVDVAPPFGAAERALRYLPWAAVQQAVLLVVIAPRLASCRRWSPATACWLAGAAFALLHLPNFGLMIATVAAGAVFAWAGRRQAALLPLVAVHWLLGTLLAWLATPWLLRNAEVGGRYLMGSG